VRQTKKHPEKSGQVVFASLEGWNYLPVGKPLPRQSQEKALMRIKHYQNLALYSLMKIRYKSGQAKTDRSMFIEIIFT
jgi:hypothetical protein